MKAYLLNDVNEDTTGDAVRGIGCSLLIQISFTSLGGGSITIQGTMDNGDHWITLTYGGNPAIFTAEGIYKMDYVGKTLQIRGVLSGATSPELVRVIVGD